INRDIRDRLGVMASIAATGQSRELESVRGDLTSLINRRQIAIGRTASFSARIEELNRERTALEITDRGDAVQILAPAPGFFSKYYDGYESLITPAMMSSMSIADYIRLTERAPPAPAPVHVGRMVPTGIWYFAVPLDLHQGEWLRKGQQVQLEFDQVTRRVPATVYDLRLENNTEMMVAVFTSDHMSDDIINLRVGEVTIFSAQHTGLRIPTSALYFRILPDGARERGVYVLDGNTIRFRLIYPVYEEAAFLLSDPNPSVRITSDPDDPDTAPRRIPSPVRKYDLVITRGVDLYDGKTVQ
ncbi:MAG: hypothetical protein FWH00_00360, partial [Oscillospiraceae bacterium]|nr:hypothetical protein [Oscillospiraceae bacterium]